MWYLFVDDFRRDVVVLGTDKMEESFWFCFLWLVLGLYESILNFSLDPLFLRILDIGDVLSLYSMVLKTLIEPIRLVFSCSCFNNCIETFCLSPSGFERIFDSVLL